MFISTAERISIKNDLETLSKLVGEMNAELVYLTAKVKVLEGRKPAKKKMTEEQRKKQREYARRYQAKKRLEKKNGNGISTTGQ